MFDPLIDSVKTLHDRLRDHRVSLSVAESCTGGLLGAAVTSMSGSSDVFAGGAITYSNRMKKSVLGVDETTLVERGAVSEPVVRQMAAGASESFETACAVGVSGIAGPEGGTDDKPVGLVHFGFVAPGNTHHERRVFDGNRNQVRFRSVKFAIKVICELLRTDDQV